METFSHRYKLVQATPTHPAGRTLRWSGSRQRFYFAKMTTFLGEVKEDIYADLEGPSYTLAQIKNENWFLPLDEEKPFIPAFPSRVDLDEYVYLTPDCRMVDDVDVCRCLNGLFESEQFQSALYEFYREQYNKYYELSDEN